MAAEQLFGGVGADRGRGHDHLRERIGGAAAGRTEDDQAVGPNSLVVQQAGCGAPLTCQPQVPRSVESKMCTSCSHRPTTDRWASESSSVMSVPASVTVPADGSRNRSSTTASVVLPDPLG